MNRSRSSRCRRSSRAWRWRIAIRPVALEAGQKTFYAVSPIPKQWTRAQADSFLREYNSRSIRNLTIHEAMPGHYLQLAHANQYPSTLRAVLSSGPFIEGWAVYTERVMSDAGYLNGDPLMKLVQLKWYLRTIVNALLDQAVHVDGISREAAMKLMTESGFQEEREAAGKWTRAQLTSAQLPVYFVGALEHFALRAEAEQRAGAAFSTCMSITTRCCRTDHRRCASRASSCSTCPSNSERLTRSLAADRWSLLSRPFLSLKLRATSSALALAFLSQLRAQANSMPRMPRPTGMTTNAGPGSTIMQMPTTSTEPPTMPMAMRLAMRYGAVERMLFVEHQ